MLPTIKIFGITIGMYGLMIAIGLITGISIAVVRSKKYGFLRQDVLFASFFGCIGLFIGAKLLYILIMLPQLIKNLEQLSAAPDLILAFFLGGFVFYGGLLGAVIGIFIYCRLFRLDFLPMLDHLIPSIPIIHAFGRLGCFFAGCCYGIPYSGVFAVSFHNAISAPDNIQLFPVQLTESVINITAGILLLIYAARPRRCGKVAGIYLLYYAIMRFILEFFRGDIARGQLLGLSTSQWISLLLIPCGIALLLYTKYTKENNRNKL
jgi:phosphatidylglycerol:prolipoprotein diacylglycerol transferase